MYFSTTVHRSSFKVMNTTYKTVESSLQESETQFQLRIQKEEVLCDFDTELCQSNLVINRMDMDYVFMVTLILQYCI